MSASGSYRLPISSDSRTASCHLLVKELNTGKMLHRGFIDVYHTQKKRLTVQCL